MISKGAQDTMLKQSLLLVIALAFVGCGKEPTESASPPSETRVTDAGTTDVADVVTAEDVSATTAPSGDSSSSVTVSSVPPAVVAPAPSADQDGSRRVLASPDVFGAYDQVLLQIDDAASTTSTDYPGITKRLRGEITTVVGLLNASHEFREGQKGMGETYLRTRFELPLSEMATAMNKSDFQAAVGKLKAVMLDFQKNVLGERGAKNTAEQ